MKRQDEERIPAQHAKAMAMICVRNSMLEGIHSGRVPVTRTGDFSDVFVTDGDGDDIQWTELSCIDDDEMRDLMRQVVNRLYTFQLRLGESEFLAFVDRFLSVGHKWDEPVLDPGLTGVSRPDAAD